MTRRSSLIPVPVFVLVLTLLFSPESASADMAGCGTKSFGPVTTNLTLQASDFVDPWSGECAHEIFMLTMNNHITITLPDTASIETVFLSIRHASTNGSFTVVASPNDGGQILATGFTTLGRFANFSHPTFGRWSRAN